MRIIFAGSPEIALPSLERLHRSQEICAVLTNPDRPTGRGRGLRETPVAILARELGLPTIKPERLGRDARAEAAGYGAELLVVAAYGRFFGPKFLSLFPKGAINLHPSLLPKYRGPSPIPAAILAGETETGVTIQRLAQEMDSGDILAQERMALEGRETTETLIERSGLLGARMLEEVIESFDRIEPRRQREEDASYCKLITKEEGLIDWHSRAEVIDRMIRAYYPWPEAQTSYEGAKLLLLEAEPYSRGGNQSEVPGKVLGVDKQAGILVQTGDGVLAVKRLKLQSKKALSWKDFLNGVHEFVGSVLGG